MTETLRIYVCDDSITSLFMTKALIAKHNAGHVVNTSSHPKQCINEFNDPENQYDLVILDVNLPGDTNGLDLAEFIGGKATENETDIMIALLTANTQPAVQKKAKDLGLKAVLTKPLKFADLEMLLEAACLSKGG